MPGSGISLADAQSIVSAGEAAARAHGIAVAVSVVDEGGHLVAFERMDGAPFGTVRFSERKAMTSAALGLPTAAMAQAAGAVPGLISAAFDGIAFVAGGVPLVREGALVGGIGVAGGVGDQDHVVATAAHAGLQG